MKEFIITLIFSIMGIIAGYLLGNTKGFYEGREYELLKNKEKDEQ
jgi:uncharacterized membrane protein YhdT